MSETQDTGHPRRWAVAAALMAAVSAIWLWSFWPTAQSLAAIWWRSETFAHGMLIGPISAFLVWRAWPRVRGLTPAAWPYGLLLIAALGGLWWAAVTARVLVVEQFAFVALLPALVLALLGPSVARALAFPLLYLLFAVPVGEALIPPLMEFTAAFTVQALRLTGIPVYQEGMFFSIPSGDWSVVEGCSGLRYLIASVALGALYAYLTYRSPWRRAAFVAASIVVPIIANGLRAYMIVMIAHLSDMQLALGVDHYIYGWVFFGLVMFALFTVGAIWREEGAAGAVVPGVSAAVRPPWAVAVLSAALVAAWPQLDAGLRAAWAREATAVSVALPEDVGGWRRGADRLTDWQPRYVAADAVHSASYGRLGQQVALTVAYYSATNAVGEAINSQNVMVVQKHPVWRLHRETRYRRDAQAAPGTVTEARLAGAGQQLLAWHWYWAGGRHTADPYLGKVFEVWGRLAGAPDGAGLVVVTEASDGLEAARERLETFLGAAMPQLNAALRDAGRAR